MSEEPGRPHVRAGERETVWAPRRTVLTVVLGLPGIFLSAVMTGLLLSAFFDPPVAVAVALVACCSVVVVRVVFWTQSLARRVVVATDTHLEVRRGARVLRQIAWTDVASISLVRGQSLWRTTFDFASVFADFPYIATKFHDIWDVGGVLPPVLAVLPDEFRRLESVLDEICAGRALRFTVEGDE